ncbi:hypothetical protein MMC30_003498 [Trapelia coarctata]|nr:hypothetical protein [Trapelia coarctata]
MSDDEERVTKPFKFVTAGTYLLSSPSGLELRKYRFHRQDAMAKCFDARFPNQNQYVVRTSTTKGWQGNVLTRTEPNIAGKTMSTITSVF